MEIMFLSDREDSLFKSLYTYFSNIYTCQYQIGTGDADLIVSNCVTIDPGKTIYFASDPNDYLLESLNRRLKVGFLQKVKHIFCPSLYAARVFYERFRIRCGVQYPFFPPTNYNPQNIVYNPKFAVDHSISTSDLSDEIFQPYQDELSTAKLYISGPGLIDSGVVEAMSRGIPVVFPDENWVKEFFQPGDQKFRWGTTEWVGATKKGLRDMYTKTQSSKYSNMSNLNDKIQKALEKKPVASNHFQPTQPNKPPHQVIGRRSNRITRVEPRTTATLPDISERTIYVSGSCTGISGYDNLVYETVRGLKSIGVDVRINATNQVNYSICPGFQDIHVSRPPHVWEIIITPPCNLSFSPPGKKSVVLTMWETDYLEPEWVKHLNNAYLVCVPSQWAVTCFKKCGVKTPIVRTPLGFDPLVFNPIGEFPTTCTFGTAAALSAGGLRKNTGFIIDLFTKAFPKEKDVKLKVKVSSACKLVENGDERVEIIREMLPPPKLANWYRSNTAFINASYAEGFGLHLIESMACGRPLISTHYSAVTEYFDESVGWISDHDIIKASGGAYSGHWGKPVGGSIIKNMRKVYENQEKAKEKGEVAYLKSRDFTWKMFGSRLTKALRDYEVINL